MKTLLSYIGFEEFFLLIRIITTINFITVVIENLVRWVIKKKSKNKIERVESEKYKNRNNIFLKFPRLPSSFLF